MFCIVLSGILIRIEQKNGIQNRIVECYRYVKSENVNQNFTLAQNRITEYNITEYSIKEWTIEQWNVIATSL